MFPPLETERLRLRTLGWGDLEAFVAYRSHPEVARYQSWEAPYPTAEAETLIARLEHATPGIPGEWYQIALELRHTGELAGDCAFCVSRSEPRQAEIGITLAPAFQGRGLGTEAVTALLGYLFGQLSLHRVRAICDVKNEPSARLLARVGMRREAHFIEHVWFKGGWGSEYEYALLCSEWLQSQE
ncbi:MAG: family N-acetyltransferase [Armatimonadetes bacterium]|jgi:aminoglycoside 6'-N-acetyltransferase|nr:family N-acetyltransferase [Armatimonadota bacterium]